MDKKEYFVLCYLFDGNSQKTYTGIVHLPIDERTKTMSPHQLMEEGIVKLAESLGLKNYVPLEGGEFLGSSYDTIIQEVK